MSDEVEVTIPTDLSQAQERYFKDVEFNMVVHTMISMNEEGGNRRMVEYAITGFLVEHSGDTISLPQELVGVVE